MRSRMKAIFPLLLVLPIAGVSSRSARAQAVQQPGGATTSQVAEDDKPRPFEVDGGFAYMRTNQPPGACGCFNMLGGSGGFGYTVKDSPYSVVADVAFLHAGTITGTGYNLNILAVTGGVRYRLPVKRRDVQPFAQGLVGIAHASGTGAQAPNPAAGNAGASLALTAGGGLELPVSPRFTVRLFEADYLLTTFDNGSNNKQNNLRFSFGAVFRF